MTILPKGPSLQDAQNVNTDFAYICEILFLYVIILQKEKNRNKAKLNGLCAHDPLGVIEHGRDTEKHYFFCTSRGFGVSVCATNPEL